MPAMMGRQFINRRPHIAGAARSYGIIKLNLTASAQTNLVETKNPFKSALSVSSVFYRIASIFRLNRT